MGAIAPKFGFLPGFLKAGKMQMMGEKGPTHLVALYVATAGLQGNALGSDEEEIILMVYVLIDALQNKVSGR